jgi:hypothetical protein
MSVKIAVVWDVTPCSLVNSTDISDERNDDREVNCRVTLVSPGYMVSHPRREPSYKIVVEAKTYEFGYNT